MKGNLTTRQKEQKKRWYERNSISSAAFHAHEKPPQAALDYMRSRPYYLEVKANDDRADGSELLRQGADHVQ